MVGDASLRDVVQAFAPMIEAEVLGTYDATLGTADRSTLIEIGDMKAELLLLKKC